MKLSNLIIREAIKKNNLKYWMVADKLGINDGNFSRMLRKELPEEKEKEIIDIIKELEEENKHDNK